MKNYVQQGEVLDLVAPAGGVVAGEGYVIGSIFVVAAVSAAAGQPFSGDTTGVFELTKNTGAGTDFAAGGRLWWDNTAKRAFPASAAGRFPIGAAVEAAPTTANIVRVRLDGVAVVAAV